MHSKFFLSPFTLFPFFLSQNVQYLQESTNNTINPHPLYPSLFSERTCPVNNFKCDPAGITHFNVGDAGASLYTTWLKAQPWSLFHKASFGHGNFQIFNSTTAQWTWHENSNSESQISDSVIVTCKA
jgi:hypothetical protein